MKEFQLTVDEKAFNLLWRSLADRESELQSNIELVGEGSDAAALLGNELVFLRLTKQELEEKASQAGFSKGAFSLEEGHIDLSGL